MIQQNASVINKLKLVFGIFLPSAFAFIHLLSMYICKHLNTCALSLFYPYGDERQSLKAGSKQLCSPGESN